MRLIAIVLKEDNNKVRNSETMMLLDYGFDLYEAKLLKEKESRIDTITLDKANKEKVDVVLKDDLKLFKKKTDKDKKYNLEVKLMDIKLPIKKGDKVGSVVVKDNNNKTLSEVDITVLEDINKINILGLYFRNIKEVLTGTI